MDVAMLEPAVVYPSLTCPEGFGIYIHRERERERERTQHYVYAVRPDASLNQIIQDIAYNCAVCLARTALVCHNGGQISFIHNQAK